MKPFAGSHIGSNISKELNAIAKRGDIPQIKIHLFVDDKNIEGERDADCDSGKCYVHSLQRIIEESLKFQTDSSCCKTKHFNYSGLAQQKLKSSSQVLNSPNHQLVQDVSTRWNST